MKWERGMASSQELSSIPIVVLPMFLLSNQLDAVTTIGFRAEGNDLQRIISIQLSVLGVRLSRKKERTKILEVCFALLEKCR